MFFRLFLLFTLVPALELYLIIKVGQSIGAFNTLLMLGSPSVLLIPFSSLSLLEFSGPTMPVNRVSRFFPTSSGRWSRETCQVMTS
jgi:hypothetical protein